MSVFELILVAISLSMDAFAVAVCKGLSMKKVDRRYTVVIALFFGAFQAFMPLIGYFLGSRFEHYITSVDHWIAFILLALIGGGMIKESREKTEEETFGGIKIKELFLLAIATSIDALAVGIAFACTSLPMTIVPSVLLIGITTFLLTALGVWVGNRFGERYRSRAELTGGIILIAIGLKILLQDLGILHLPF